MKQFSFDQAKIYRQGLETELANRLWNASNKNITTHVSQILKEDNSDYANFLITIRDQVVKEWKSEIWSQLLEIKDKVKNKSLLKQSEVELLQSYNLKCRRWMNVEGRVFNSLVKCDFTDANMNNITVNGDINQCRLWSKNDEVTKWMNIFGSITQSKITGSLYQNTISGDISFNEVSHAINNNIILGSVTNNQIASQIYWNTISKDITLNKISRFRSSNMVYPSCINYNVVWGQIRMNRVLGQIRGNTCKNVTENSYETESDLTDPSNKKLSQEEAIQMFWKEVVVINAGEVY